MENSKLSQLELEELFPKNIQSMIQPRYSLLKELNETKAKSVIVQLIKQIPNYENKIKDLELILMICLYIENLKIVNVNNIKKKLINQHYLLVFVMNFLIFLQKVKI